MAIQLGLEDGQVLSRKVDLTCQRTHIVTSQTTTSTSAADLATTGPAITLSPGITMDQLLSFGAYSLNTNAGVATEIDLQLNGAVVTGENYLYYMNGANYASSPSKTVLAEAIPTGQTHRLRYLVGANTGTYANRFLVGVCL